MGSKIKVGDVVRLRGDYSTSYIVVRIGSPVCNLVYCTLYKPLDDTYSAICLSDLEKVGV